MLLNLWYTNVGKCSSLVVPYRSNPWVIKTTVRIESLSWLGGYPLWSFGCQDFATNKTKRVCLISLSYRSSSKKISACSVSAFSLSSKLAGFKMILILFVFFQGKFWVPSQGYPSSCSPNITPYSPTQPRVPNFSLWVLPQVPKMKRFGVSFFEKGCILDCRARDDFYLECLLAPKGTVFFSRFWPEPMIDCCFFF